MSVPNQQLTSLLHQHHMMNLDNFNGLCFHEGVPHSVTGLRQWFAYLHICNVSEHLMQILLLQTKIGFCLLRKIFQTALRLTLREWSLSDSHSLIMLTFAHRPLFIANDISMLFGLNEKRKLHTITCKNNHSPYAKLCKLDITLALCYLDGHLYYPRSQTCSFFFVINELAQIQWNVGHAPAGADSCALRRSYPLEAEISNLSKLQETTESCKGYQLYS